MATYSFTDDWKRKILQAVLMNVPLVSPAQVYIALFLSDPGPTGSATEVSGGDYARVAVPWSAVVIDPVTHEVSISNSALFQFPKAKTDWGTIGWNAIMDSASGGTVIASAALVKPREIMAQDIVQYEAGDIRVKSI